MKRRPHRSIVGSWLGTALALVAGPLCALELGGARLISAAGAPLDIEIALQDVQDGELDDLKPLLPPNSRSAELAEATVELARGGDGAPVLRVRTIAPVSAKELRFVVVADWGRGRKFREYLLAFAVSAPPAVAAAAPTIAPAAPDATPSAAAAAPAATTTPVAPLGEAPSTRTVRAGDTLMSVSREWAASTGATLAQTMLGIYRDNPRAFGPRGMSELLVGSVLTLPPAERLQSTAAGAASNEVGRTLGIWRTAGSPAAAPTSAVPAPVVPAPVVPAPVVPAPAAPAPVVPAPVAPAPVVPAPEETAEAKAARLEQTLQAQAAELEALKKRLATTAPEPAGDERAWWVAALLGLLSAALLVAVGVLLMRVRRAASKGDTDASATETEAAREMTLELPSVKPSRSTPENLPDVLMGEPARSPRVAAVASTVAAPAASAAAVATPSPVASPNVADDLEGDPPPIDEANSKIDLARAFIEMGHHDAAILELQAALRLGDETQRAEAIRLLDSLPKS
jgi:FimV-like protein